MQVERNVQLLLLRHKEQIMVSIIVHGPRQNFYNENMFSVSPLRTYRSMCQAFLLNIRSESNYNFDRLFLYSFV